MTPCHNNSEGAPSSWANMTAHELCAARYVFFLFFLNVLFLNIFRITPGLPNITEVLSIIQRNII